MGALTSISSVFPHLGQRRSKQFVIVISLFRLGGRHIGASNGEGTTAGRRGVIGIRGDPERNQNLPPGNFVCRSGRKTD